MLSTVGDETLPHMAYGADIVVRFDAKADGLRQKMDGVKEDLVRRLHGRRGAVVLYIQ